MTRTQCKVCMGQLDLSKVPTGTVPGLEFKWHHLRQTPATRTHAAEGPDLERWLLERMIRRTTKVNLGLREPNIPRAVLTPLIAPALIAVVDVMEFYTNGQGRGLTGILGGFIGDVLDDDFLAILGDDSDTVPDDLSGL